MFTRLVQGFLAGVLTLLPLVSFAPVRSLDLQADCVDFAMHPETGDVVALAAKEKDVLLFRSADLQAGKSAPSAKIHIDALPTSVCYKQFGEKKLFAVACAHESQILLLNASDLKLIQKIDLGETYAEGMGVSTNPADPFLYYSSGERGLYFINLRDMKTRGELFPRCGQFALSAEGDVLYFSANETPSGLMSMQRTSEITADKPAFRMLRYADQTPSGYLPDRHNFYTAVGEEIFTKSLDKRVGNLDFSAYCFLEKQPVLIGFAQQRNFGGHYNLDTTQDLELVAASTNTFEHAGQSLALPGRAPVAKRRPNDGFDDDVVPPGSHVRVFADEARASLIVGLGSRLHVVPIPDLKLPKEPFLRASLQGQDVLMTGKAYTYQVKPADPSVKVEISAMPDGMKAQDLRLTWTPTANQIGPATVELTLKHGKSESTQSVHLQVNHPQLILPFVAYDFAATPDNKRILVWEKPDEPDHTRAGGPGANETCRIALIDLETEKVIIERKLKRGISSAAISSTHAAIRIDEERCEVLKLETLQREKSLLMEDGIQRVSFFGRYLVLSSYTGHQVYDTETFKLVKEWDSESGGRTRMDPINGAPIVTSGISDLGLIANGILYDRDLKPVLFFEPAGILQVAGGGAPWNLPATDSRPNPFFDDWDQQRFDQRDRVISSMTQAVPEQQLLVDLKTRMIQGIARADEASSTFELWIATRGSTASRQTLLKLASHVNEFPQYQPKLQMVNGTALVLFQKHFFRWPLPAPEKAEKGSEPLSWKFKQTAFLLGESGKTVLKHEAIGGTGRYKYSLLTPIEAISIDETTGDVTIDESALGGVLHGPFEQHSPLSSVKEIIRSVLAEQGPQMSEIAGRPSKGIGVAVPIHVQVIDSKDEESELKYFVVAELTEAEVEKRLKSAAAPGPGAPKAGRTTEGASDELGDLKRRLSVVEARLDLMTRQLAKILEKLEE